MVPQAVSGLAQGRKVVGIDLKKLSVNFFFVTAGGYTTWIAVRDAGLKWKIAKKMNPE